MSGGGHKRREHEEHEEHENHERWLVSYADMMTLLMVLFIVMFAISQVDQKKFAALKTGLSAGFGAPVAILSGADQLLDVGGSVAPDSLNLAGQSGSANSQARNDSSSSVNPEAVAKLAQATEKAQVTKEVDNLKKAQQQLQAALNRSGQKGRASFRFDERGLVVSIATDKVLFASGSARLQPGGEKILNTLAPTLKALPNRLSIDGHTNSIPIRTAQFPSNWELSSDRATGVLRFLHSRDGIPNGQMSATGYADTRPLLPASNPQALSANRRVEIVVVASVDNSAGRAVESLGNAASSGAKPISPGGPLVAAQSGSGKSGNASNRSGTTREGVVHGVEQGARQLSR
jgi:chemotaxis protein MotB